MITSPVEICNSALIKVGAGRILSLNDDSERALLMKEQYPKLRDDLIFAHPWNFATKRETLAASVTPPLYHGVATLVPIWLVCMPLAAPNIANTTLRSSSASFVKKMWQPYRLPIGSPTSSVAKLTRKRPARMHMMSA